MEGYTGQQKQTIPEQVKKGIIRKVRNAARLDEDIGFEIRYSYNSARGKGGEYIIDFYKNMETEEVDIVRGYRIYNGWYDKLKISPSFRKKLVREIKNYIKSVKT